MNVDTILSRVQALLNKTVEKGCTPEEAAAATALAQSLLFKHNLSFAQAKDHRKADKEDIKKHTTKAKGAKVSFRWRHTLASVIAMYNWCEVIVDARSEVYWIIGKPSNVTVVEYLADVIGNQIHKLGQTACSKQPTSQRPYYMSFCRGAVSTIRRRLEEQQAKNVAAAAGSTALVVQSKQEIEAAVNAFFPKLGTARKTKIGNYEGFLAGRKAGESISMNKGIGGHAESRLAIQ